MYKEKFTQYENRAKQIKTQVLSAAPVVEPTTNGGGATGEAKKPPKKK